MSTTPAPTPAEGEPGAAGAAETIKTVRMAEGGAPPAKSAGAGAADAAGEGDGPVRQRFDVLSNRFVGFEEQLNARKKKRAEEIEQRFEELHRKHDEVVEALRLEKKNSAVQMKALQKWLETRIDEWTERLERPIHERLDRLGERVEVVAAEVVKVDAKITEERDKFPAMIDARAKELLEQIEDFRHLFADGQKRREEREEEILRDIVKQGNQLTEEVRAERTVREERFTHVNREIEHEVRVRAKEHAMAQERAREDFAALNAKIEREVEVRREGDEDLAQAVRHYTAALQDSIRIVSEE